MSSHNFRSRTSRRPGAIQSTLALFLTLFLAVPPWFTLLAGDILRGGGGSQESHSTAPETGNPTAAAVQAGLNGHDTLARTTQALQAVQAMQAAAHAAAVTGANNLGLDPNHPGQQLPNVPNGLGVGGLQIAPGVPVDLAHPSPGDNPDLWQGASLPTQTTSGAQTNVSIVQTAQQALLNWQTFNIGRDTHLTFDQTAGGANASQWIAFNKVNDPSGVPSQILGSLDAIGQVYVINANGIIFGGSSQINLHALVASALPINDNLIARGLLNNPDNQFLFSALPLAPGGNNGGTPTFTPPTSNTPDGHYGDVTVQAGAQITSPTSADHVGGRVALIGANVTNDGTITTPDGQTILAAGLQVGFGAHDSSDPSLRGLDVYVGAVADPLSLLAPYAGTATNSGLIDAPRADVTIAGKMVDQFGFINSSTSVSLNGRIDLLADFNANSFVFGSNSVPANLPPFVFQSSGTVTLGTNSVTQILPELTSIDRVVGTQLALSSQINLQGLAVHEAAGAILLAPSASVTIEAGNWIPVTGFYSVSNFVFSGGQIYLDADAIIDVSGSQDVIASVAENIVAAQLLGPELADSPLQRNGPLRGQTVYIDITKTGTYNGQTWVGTPLADVSGYVNLVQRTVGELTTNGGNVTLSAGESVIMQPGSSINVSGGWINYAGANVQTTQVVSGGHVFDISQATPDRVYDGILNGFSTVHTKWGVIDTFGNPLPGSGQFEAGYIQGGNGGSLTISAPSMAVDGQLSGTTIAGPRQTTTPPAPSSLSLVFQAQDPTVVPFLSISPTPPNIVFGSGSLPPADPFALDNSGNPIPLRADRKHEVILSPDFVNVDGFGSLKIDNSDGNITVPADVVLTTGIGGEIDPTTKLFKFTNGISFSAANIDIEGRLTSPDGSLAFNVYDFSPFQLGFLKLSLNPQTPPPDPARGHFILGAKASLDAAGMITDNRSTSVLPVSPTYTPNGGNVTVNSYDVDLAQGSSIDVSGCVTVSGTGQVAYGTAGAITIRSGQDPNIPSLLGGQLTLAGNLTGYSGDTGGSLSIQAPLIQVGGSTTDLDTLLLSPDFFSQGGFDSFTLTGLGAATAQPNQFLPGVLIAPGTTIEPVAQSLLANLDLNGRGTVTLTPTVLPQGLRTPVSLSFRTPGVRSPFITAGILPVVRGDFVMGEGSLIQTDPLAKISITGNTVAVLGSIIAPGGTISITGDKSTVLNANPSEALPTVDLGPTSFLSAAGMTVLTPNSLDLRTGRVLAGGNITVSGNIVAENGSRMDVSGATGILDLAPGFGGTAVTGSLTGAPFVATRVDSNGGFITLTGTEELFTDATFEGAAGGPSAFGGSLSISSGRFTLSQLTPLDETLVVTQSALTIPASFYPAGQTAIGHAVVDANNQPLAGLGYFAADKFNNSGLASLTLQGFVQFSGPVTIDAGRSISVANGGVVFGDAAINLNAPYVQIGTAFAAPVQPQQVMSAFLLGSGAFNFLPMYGAGSLNISATLIDVGNLSLQGIGNANLVANNGDVRGDGTFDVAGNLSITAGQIYPPTAVSFTIAAYDYKVGSVTNQGSIELTASVNRQLPLSAGGQLNLYSSVINDGGVLRAPIGTINIGWDGTGTGPIDLITGHAVPVAQQVTLSSTSVTSVSAVDPVTGTALTIPYGTNPNGTSWIDPTGIDITAGGVPTKSINIAGANVSNLAGSTIDVRGGGDLYAYEFVSGTGGTSDILGSSSSFAVIPGYQAAYAPFAPYSTSAGGVFGTDQGYVNGNLTVGEQVFLNASNGLPAGTYTLLPARYALLPGAFLITPEAGTPTTASLQADGSTIVAGYRFSGFDTPASQPLFSSFEVAPQTVVRQRAQYTDFSANTFLKQSALTNNQSVPRLPIDAGYLLLDATQSMNIQGALLAQAPTGGRGGEVDISSPLDILIAGSGTAPEAGVLVLNSSELSAFGAESLLIGGFRTTSSTGTTVTVTTDEITVDNAGAPLSVRDLILAANSNLTLAPGADIEASGSLSSATSLQFGNLSIPGSGDGVLLRVSADPNASISRLGVDSSTVPREVIGANTLLAGASVTLDSTYGTSLDPTATIRGTAVNLDSGQISIQLPNGIVSQPTAGLVLAGVALQNVESVQSLSLLSYSSIDIYGSGTIKASNALQLHAGEIRGFNNGGAVDFAAKNITLDNVANASAPGAVASPSGTLQFDAGTIQIGSNQLNVDQFAALTLNASGGILTQGSGGFATQGDLTLITPLITGALGSTQSLTASGAVHLEAPGSPSIATVIAGLGANLTISGASLSVDTNISLPSGQLTLHATNGDLVIGSASPSTLDVSGTAQTFFDLVKYTSGGQINLIADNGAVNVDSGGTINIAAQSGGGNAGTLSVSAPNGSFIVNGTLNGQGGANGLNGSFSLDVGSLSSLGNLDAMLNTASFTQSRSIRVRTGDVVVDGTATSHTFDLSADQGSIDVTGSIDASGATGGTINLIAYGSVTLSSGSILTVAGQNFDDAGKGGAVSLEAGSETNGTYSTTAVVDIENGSTIDLSVASNNANSASLGDFTGTLHLRAPQTASSTDLQINPIDGTILNASSILVEGYKIFSATAGSINNQEANVFANGTTFGGNSAAISARLLANNASLAPVTVVVPGAEIINPNGDLTLGSPNSDSSSDWDLSTYRFGPNNAPGVLTLRAAGNLVFYNALSDGFTSSAYNAVLLAQNSLLPANVQSWSYRLVAGADFSAVDFQQVEPLSLLAQSSGSLQLGKNYGNNVFGVSGPSALTSTAVATRYQVIRTGTGDIDISAGRDVQLLNQFATIFTAGTRVSDPTMGGTFDLPKTDPVGQSTGNLGVAQQARPGYLPQYSYAGGNVTISAQRDISHLTQMTDGTVIDDSSRELPNNWLYRRGYIDPTTGLFAPVTRNTGNDVGSTTWWVDFSNFFEGVGALGGGNVTLTAGHDVSNVDAVAPTNARMPGKDSMGHAIAPNAANLVELGGGDVTVTSGNDINGGVYYVERGQGTLTAGNSIHTNSTRSPSRTTLVTPDDILPSITWLPTTLFLGKGSFDVSARGDVLLGPVANPFLLPEGVNNVFWYKTYFSTYASTDAVNVSSLTGDVTLRENATLPTASSPILQAWLSAISLLGTISGQQSASFYQPWLRLDENSVTAPPFTTVVSLMPSTLRVSAFSGNLNVDGNLTLFPAPNGTVDLAAKGAINGLQPNGLVNASLTTWMASTINLSDADPARIPGITSPFAFRTVLATPTGSSANQSTDLDFLTFIDNLFAETGSTQGAAAVLQAKQALHAQGILHADDPNPIHIYAGTGDISGFTLFSGKAARVVASKDITDIALYIQNDKPSDISVVAAGRDIIAYDPNSSLRVSAQAVGNEVQNGPAAGDIQISGPGTLEVLAGRNLDLGVGPNNPDGTGVGITSIGNARNPFLPFVGADVIAGAGIDIANGLAHSTLDFKTFVDQFLDPTNDSVQSARYLPDLGTLLGLTGASDSEIWSRFDQLPPEKQDQLALDIFYLVLRDAGRDHNDPSSPGFGQYTNGLAAIAALFPGNTWQGDISLTSREIKTANGGNISLFAPGGALNVGINVTGGQAADQGILTEDGGNISIFTHSDVNVGTSRIFTLRGGNEIIWSTVGNIDAGSSSKTVQSAPPTRVLIDPQSGDVKTDLAGLATGGGIGVLETVAGVPPADVDLIAPVGTINAGDAGIRVSGNINIAALLVLNVGNIQVGGSSAGVPTVAAPNIAGLTNASTTTAATSDAAAQIANQNNAPIAQQDTPSIISVEVIGYGGGDDQDEEQRRRKKKQQEQPQTSAEQQSLQVSNTQNSSRIPHR